MKFKASHARHHTEHVVVDSEHLDSVSGVHASEVKSGVVNTGHVTCARGLVLLGLKREGVHVDTSGLASLGGHTLVMLVGLDKLEVLGHTGGETLVTVELELGRVVGGDVSANIRAVLFLNPDDFLAGWLKLSLILEEAVSSPVNWSCSMRYSWETWAKRRRSSVSR